MIVSLEAFKLHMNITTEIDDALLQQKLEAAQGAVGNYIGVDLATAYTSYVPATYVTIPATETEPEQINIDEPAVESDAPAVIKEACLQYGCYLYEYREADVTTGERAQPLPLGIFDLVGRYKTWVF